MIEVRPERSTIRRRAVGIDHAGPVWGVAFSPDGRLLASASEDGKVRLWHTASGRLNQVLVGHDAGVNAVAFSADGRRIASAAENGQIRFWTRDGQPIGLLAGYRWPVNALAFSACGAWLASAGGLPGEPAAVKIWRATGDHEWATLYGHRDEVMALAFAPRGSVLASASLDGTIRLWDMDTGELWSILQGHQAGVYALAFAPHGGTLLSGGADGTVRAWATVEQGDHLLCQFDHPVVGLAASPRGSYLAIGLLDGTITLWSVARGKAVATFRPGRQGIFALAYGPGGKQLAWGGKSRIVELWDVLVEPADHPSPGMPGREVGANRRGQQVMSMT